MSSVFGSARTTTGFGGLTQTSSAGTIQDMANDPTLSNPPEDSVSDICFSPQAEFLSVASWDKKVRIYEVSPQGESRGVALYDHQAPVLSTHWSLDGTKVASGGCDNAVRVFDVQSQQAQQVGQHESSVRCVRFVAAGPSDTPILASAGWDKKLHYWDLRTPNPVSTIALPERAYSMDTSKQLLVVGTAERHILAINLSNPGAVAKTLQSSLKFQTRVVSCWPAGDGFAVGSIEGRCGIQYVDEVQAKSKNFSFKCHRQTPNPAKNEVDIYAVNAISFHPIEGTFCTAGADGSLTFWDKDSRHRLKGYPPLGCTIPATAFNRDGSIFAYAQSYDWSKGHQYNNKEIPHTVRFHQTKQEETKCKPKRR